MLVYFANKQWTNSIMDKIRVVKKKVIDNRGHFYESNHD